MDVHRSRFIAYPTPSISAAAFSRSTDCDGPQPNLKLAIGRVNGFIELWSLSRGSWVQETIVRDSAGRSIDGLLWTQEPDEKDVDGTAVPGQHRLFSTSCSPAVTEWNLAEGFPKKQSSGNFSDVWCIAAQPRRSVGQHNGAEGSSQEIVAGCSHGELVLLSTDEDGLQFKRILARATKKTSCLSITYQNYQRVVAGFVDGVVRVYDTVKLVSLRSISLGASLPGAVKNIHVWQVKCLPNGDVVSGDSNGNVTIFDGKSYSPYSTITAHETDCLDLVVSADGNTIFSGSMDGRIAVLKKAPGLTGRAMWTKQSHRRHHNGDVKCLTAFDGKDTSVVVSGGSDVKAMVSPLRDHGRAPSLTLPHLPRNAPLVSARHARLVASWWEKTISIWRIARSTSLEHDSQPPRKLVAKIKLTSEHDITTVAISDDGRMLAASTQSELKLFQLRRRTMDDTLGIRKVALHRAHGTVSTRLMSFSPDGKWLALATVDDELRILRLTEDTTNPKLVQVLSVNAEFERRRRASNEQTGFAQYDRTIVHIAFTRDSSVVATADVAGHIDTWVLEGHEDITAPPVDLPGKPSKRPAMDGSDSDDSDDDDGIVVFYGQHWVENPRGHLLPKLESMPLILSFRPSRDTSGAAEASAVNGNPGVHATRHNPHAHSNELPTGPHHLFVLTAEHHVHEFDVLAGRTSDWSHRNPTAMLPADFHRLQDRAMGAVWDVTATRERLWLYGGSWLFMLNVGLDHGREDGPTDVVSMQLDKKTRRTRKKPRGQGAADGDDDEGGSKRRRLEQAQGRGLAGTAKRYDGDIVVDVDLDDARFDTTRALEHENEDNEDLMRLARLDDGAAEQQQVALVGADSTSNDRKHWCTTKYRSILGIVPLDDIAATDADALPEVIVVERPIEVTERSK